jgi:hypothetical protein
MVKSLYRRPGARTGRLQFVVIKGVSANPSVYYRSIEETYLTHNTRGRSSRARAPTTVRVALAAALRAHQRGGGKKGDPATEALELSQGGCTAKVHRYVLAP